MKEAHTNNPDGIHIKERALITDPIIQKTRISLDSYLDGFKGYFTTDLADFFGDKTIPYIDLLSLSNATLTNNDTASLEIDPVEGNDFKEIYDQSRIIMGAIPHMKWDLPIPEHWITNVFLKAPRNNAEYMDRIAELKGTVYDLATTQIRPGTPVRSSLSLFRTYAYFRAGENLMVSPRH